MGHDFPAMIYSRWWVHQEVVKHFNWTSKNKSALLVNKNQNAFLYEHNYLFLPTDCNTSKFTDTFLAVLGWILGTIHSWQIMFWKPGSTHNSKTGLNTLFFYFLGSSGGWAMGPGLPPIRWSVCHRKWRHDHKSLGSSRPQNEECS